MEKITLKINGETLDAEVEPAKPLLWVLREDLELTGSQFVCGASLCGACTVHVNGQAMRSCVTPVKAAIGKEITTIEGLGDPDKLHVLQEKFKEHHGLQCGFCTPGMITRAHRLLEENPNPTEEEVRFGISGNLCRCTGYQNIVKSVMAAAEELNKAETA